MIIDKLAYNSRLSKTAPMEKVIFAFTSMIICIISNSISVGIITILTMLFIIIHIGKTNIKTVFRLMTVPLFFLIFGCMAIIISISTDKSEMILYIKLGKIFLGVTKYSIFSVAITFTKSLGAVSCMYFLSLTTPVNDIFSLLRKSIIPDFIVEIAELIYRYIFVLLDVCEKIHLSQDSRLGYVNLKTGYRSTVLLVSNLFIRSMNQAEKTFTALSARGYDGTINLLLEKHKHNKPFILFGLVYIFGVTALTVFLKAGIK